MASKAHWAQFAAVITVLCSVAAARAQSPDLRQSPPSITFPEWKPVPTDGPEKEYSLSFPSAVETPYPVNNVVPITVLLPAKPPVPMPVVLVLHYWGAIDQRVERSIASELNSRGIAAVLVTLPYHLGRTPSGSRSGAMAIQPDPKKLIGTMTQCVLDVRRAVDWVVTRPEFDHQKIGIVGTSLGAIVTSLCVGVEPRFSAASSILGGVGLADVLWHSSRVVNEREKLRQSGYTRERLEQELAPIEPGHYLEQANPPKTFVIGAKYDTVIPPQATRRLVQLLDDPAVLWLDTGHYGGFFVQKRVHHEVAEFFEATFADKAYSAPGHISAPTVRLGVSLYPERRLQVAVGLDIWKADAEGSVFASLQLAPRGPQLFLGKRLDRGLAIGAFWRSEAVAPGLFWSVVL